MNILPFFVCRWDCREARREDMLQMERLTKVQVDIQITDAEVFEREFLDPDIPSRSDAILLRMIAPAIGPTDSGFEIVARHLEPVVVAGIDALRISVEARVCSGAALSQSASEVREDCWGERDWHPKDDAEALLELLFYSNENPCPSLMGFAFIAEGTGARPEFPDNLEGFSP
jgi:hypothetical protein